MLSYLSSALPAPDLLLFALPLLFAAYIVFGVVGFGSGLVASPILAQRIPVAEIVPMFAMMDCAAVLYNGFKIGQKIARDELVRLVPCMILGNIVGIWLVLALPPRVMMIVLGAFVSLYAVYTLIAPPVTARLRRGWIVPFGTVGGVFSAMFGAGGFLYAIYLSRRIDDKDAIRATMGAVLGLSNLSRLIFFAVAGVYNDGRLVMLTLLALPVMFAGLSIGHRLAAKLDRNQFIRVLCAILIVAGVSLIARAVFGS
jgi:uncharacterized membrane protein YfcA